MTDKITPCPICKCEYIYPMHHLMVFTECSHEWNPAEGDIEEAETAGSSSLIGKDAFGSLLQSTESQNGQTEFNPNSALKNAESNK